MLGAHPPPRRLVRLGHAHDQATGWAIQRHDAVPKVMPVDNQRSSVTLGGQPKESNERASFRGSNDKGLLDRLPAKYIHIFNP